MATLVLVHGGSVTARGWDPLLPRPAAPAVAVDLPGRRHRPGRSRHADAARWERSAAADVAALGLDDVLLVGHSSGGYVIPGVAARLPAGTVRGLVFVTANCPAEGQTPVESMAEKLRRSTDANREHLAAQAAGRTTATATRGWRPRSTPTSRASRSTCAWVSRRRPSCTSP